MQKVKRILAVLITVIMIASVFSACGPENTDDGTPVVHWYMRKPVGDMSQQAVVEAEANKILQEATGAKLQFHFLDNAAWENKVSVMISSGEEFDILNTSGTEFTSYLSKGSFMNISEYLDEYGTYLKERIEDFAWQAVTVDGGIYAVPSENFQVPYNTFAFKKDLVEKYGFDYKNVKDLDDVEPYLATIKEKEPNMYPLLATANQLPPLPKSHKYLETTMDGIYYNVETDDFELALLTDESIETRKKIYEFFKKGYIAKDASSKTETTSEIKAGRYAVFNGRRSETKTTNLYGFPCVESTPTYGVIGTNNVFATINAISRTSQNPDKAVHILNEIWKNTYLSNTLAYGLKDQDYTVSKGDVNNYQDISEISIVTNSGNEVKWSVWHNWLGPLWDQWDSPWNTREALDEMEGLNASAESSPIIGFIINTDPIKTEAAQFSSVMAEATPIFNTGSMPDFDAYLDQISGKFKAAGSDKILAEVRSQYKAWKASK